MKHLLTTLSRYTDYMGEVGYMCTEAIETIEDYQKQLDAYEAGLEDGFYDGSMTRNENLSDIHSYAYRRGYDKGVAMYSTMKEFNG